MFKQVEYSEILFKNSLLNFGRCAHDGNSIGNEPSVSLKVNLLFRSSVTQNC